jgi:hypothetical protein
VFVPSAHLVVRLLVRGSGERGVGRIDSTTEELHADGTEERGPNEQLADDVDGAAEDGDECCTRVRRNAGQISRQARQQRSSTSAHTSLSPAGDDDGPVFGRQSCTIEDEGEFGGDGSEETEQLEAARDIGVAHLPYVAGDGVRLKSSQVKS